MNNIPPPPDPPKINWKNCITWGDDLGPWLQRVAGTKKGEVGSYVRAVMRMIMHNTLIMSNDGNIEAYRSSPIKRKSKDKDLNKWVTTFDLPEGELDTFRTELKDRMKEIREKQEVNIPIIEEMKKMKETIRHVLVDKN